MEKFICKVCAMVINDKNYSLNSYSIPEKNEGGKILYCPFCGAPHEFIARDEREVYSVDSNTLDNSTLIILEKAVKLEIFNGDYYKVAAKMAKEDSVKKLFEGLSRIEYVHARVHNRLGGFKKFPELTQLNYEKYDTDKALLELAEKREEHAVNYYRKNSESVSNPTIKEIFRALAEVEMDHIDLAKISSQKPETGDQ